MNTILSELQREIMRYCLEEKTIKLVCKRWMKLYEETIQYLIDFINKNKTFSTRIKYEIQLLIDYKFYYSLIHQYPKYINNLIGLLKDVNPYRLGDYRITRIYIDII